MRTSLFYSLLGLASVGVMAGCQTSRESRMASGGQRNSPPATVVVKTSPPARPSNVAGTDHVRISTPLQSKALEPKAEQTASVPPPAPETPRQLPEMEPAAETVAVTPNAKVDIFATETDIANREAAALRTKPAPMNPIVLPLPVLPEVVKVAPPKDPVSSIPQVVNAAPKETASAINEIVVATPKQIAPEKDKTVTLKTTEIVYGQTDNFKTITGQVQQFRKTWRLRYADVSQEDPYGGVVVLEEGADLSRLQDGQHLRVTGVLVPPQSRTGSAIYRVKTIEVLD